MVHLRRWIIPKQLGRYQRPIRPAIRPFINDSSCVLHLAPDPGNTWIDHSSYGNHATNHGATITSEGRFGGAYRTTVGTQYLSLNPISVQEKITITAWIKREQLGYADIIGPNYWPKWIKIRLEGTGEGNAIMTQLYFTDGSNTQELQCSSITDYKWHMITVCFKSSDGKIQTYKDGEKIKEWTGYTGKKLSLADKIVIGGQIGGGSPLKGLIDEVLIFNRVLTASEIKTLYELGAV